MGIRELGKKGEALIESGEQRKSQMEQLQDNILSDTERLVGAVNNLMEASRTDENGKPIGNVQAARERVRLLREKIDLEKAEQIQLQKELEKINEEKRDVVNNIEHINKAEEDNIDKLKRLQTKMLSNNASLILADLIARMNQGEETKDQLLKSMGEAGNSGKHYVSKVSFNNSPERNFENLGIVQDNVRIANDSFSGSMPIVGKAGEAQADDSISKDNSLFNRNQDLETNKKWNEEYMPLIEANIRYSVDRIFKSYVSQEKLDSSLAKLRFMNQDELSKRYGRGFQKGTLGFNDGEISNIAYDIKQVAGDGKVGIHEIQGSGTAKINYAFVTAVHENLHMMSTNDDAVCRRRGLMVGNDETSRAMNEAFTEYFTYLSCGGDQLLGGLYPGVYSGYHSIMQKMPVLEKAVGRDCMLDAYFNNKPERMCKEVDGLLGIGSWDKICKVSYALLYTPEEIDYQSQLNEFFDRLETLIS